MNGSQENNDIKVFRDPIHGLISFQKTNDKVLLDLIDSSPFQRLRRIRQLGVSFFTYSSATHDRFSHSLGVAHLAKKLINNLNIPKNITIHDESGDKIILPGQLTLLLQATSLLHDIGHGPFSHIFESIFNLNHENISIEILKYPEISSILESVEGEITDVETKEEELFSNYFSKWIKDILSGILEPAWIREIISGQFDVDRLDYLIRDAYMCGVRYNYVDIDWILHNLEKYYKPDIKKDILVINGSKGLSSMESFIISRLHMFEQVYFHKTTRCFEGMLKNIFKRLQDIHNDEKLKLDDLTFFDEKLKDFIKNPFDLKVFLSIDDFYILTQLKLWSVNCEDRIIQDLCKSFIERSPFKMVLEIDESTNLFDFIKKYDLLKKIFIDNEIEFKYYFIEDDSTTNPYAMDYFTKKGIINVYNKSEDNINELSEKSKLIGTLKNTKFNKIRAYLHRETFIKNKDKINRIANIKI